jgi:hypothetical protein
LRRSVVPPFGFCGLQATDKKLTTLAESKVNLRAAS